MRQKVCAVFIAVAMIFGFHSLVSPVPTYAASADKCNDGGNFLGLRPWYAGLMKESSEGKFEIKSVSGDKIAGKVWTIVLNILADLFLVLGYITIAMAIYGGFLWMTSKGEPAMVAKGVNTLKYAVVGTVIAALAWVVTNTIVSIITGALSGS